MPTASLRPCAYPRCGTLVASGQRHKVKRQTSADRGYGSRWQRERRNYLLRHPLCVHCKAEGQTTTATVVDHVEPHRGDMALFWNVANWQSLCAPCHDGWKARIERVNG